MRLDWLVLAMAVGVAGLAGCSRSRVVEEVVRAFPVTSLDGVLTRSGVEFDSGITSDGNGSLKITATEPRTARLYETGDIDVEDARLLYRARIRTEDVDGQVFLEMWCRFPGRGEFFSRALHDPLTGSVEWTSQETPFFLEAGQNPDEVKLNIVIDGSGTVWVDEIELAKGPR